MGHAAYARGSAAISAHIDQQLKRTRKPDAWLLLQADRDREATRATKAEARIAELEATLVSARRSVGILRGTLETERESRKIQVEDLKFRLNFACKALKRRMAVTGQHIARS